MSNYIKQINLGSASTPNLYDIYDEYARKRLEGLSNVYSISCQYAYKSGDTFIDWDDETEVAYSAMTIKNSNFASVADEITISGATTGTNAYLVLTSTKSTNQYYVKKMLNMAIGDTVYVIEVAATASDRWLSAVSGEGTSISGTFKAIEGKIDLSEYAKKVDAGAKGTYTSTTPSVNATGSAGSQTATGTATITYKKSAAQTGSAGAATITSSSAGAATINSSEAGAATVDFTNASFAGSSATIASSGSYTPAGTISAISHSSHTHTVSVSKATIQPVISVDAASGEAGAHTHSVTVSGEITLAASAVAPAESGTVTYTPAGSVSKPNVNLTSTAKTVATAGITAVTSKFTGTAATISISGDVTGAAVADHSYTPEGTISAVSAASHSHTVNCATASVTVVTGVNNAASAGAHTHSVTTHAHAAAVKPSKITSCIWPSMSTINFTANTTQSLTTKNYGFSASQSNIMTAPTVSDAGVLSWTTVAAGTQDALSAGSVASLTGGVFSAGQFAYEEVTAAGATSTATLTATSAGAHTHSVGASATKTVTYVTGATTGTAGAINVTPTFTGTAATLAHEVTQGSFSGSTSYTPAGSIGNTYTAASTISINHVTGAALAAAPEFTGTGVRLEAAGGETSGTMTGTAASAGDHTHSIGSSKSASSITYVTGISSVSKEGAYTVTPTFTGEAATISVSASYTPEGSISGSQSIAKHSHSVSISSHTHEVVVASHTHAITLSDASVTGTAAVAVSAHTHDLSNHTHNVQIPAISA